jgi:hypothetical protein
MDNFLPANVPRTRVAALAPEEVTALSARFAKGRASVVVQTSMKALLEAATTQERSN